MKKWGFLLLALLLANTTFAQFILTKDGFVHNRYPDNYYFIECFGGLTQQELFDACMAILQKKYPDASIKTNGNETIDITQHFPDQIFYYRMIDHNNMLDIVLNLTFHFKDGRIRIDSPGINELYIRSNKKARDGSVIGDKKTYCFLSYDDYKRAKSKYSGFFIYNESGKVKEPKMKASLEEFVNDNIYDILDELYDQFHLKDW